jgi:hypothetical protein
LQTVTDLGVPGADPIYGMGLMNLTAAMTSYGGVSGLTAGGALVSADSVGVQSSGTMNMSGLNSVLSNYTVFDSFDRDFTTNLSVQNTQVQSAQRDAQAQGKQQILSVPQATFADGSRMGFTTSQSADSLMRPDADTQTYVFSFTDASGTTVAGGKGFPASASFAESLWGRSAAYDMIDSNANALMDFAAGGHFAAMEQPELFAGDLKAFVSGLTSATRCKEPLNFATFYCCNFPIIMAVNPVQDCHC